jgi:hypothetical protein
MVIKGKIIDIIELSDKVSHIVIMHKKEEAYLHICFTAYQSIMILCKQIKLEKGDLVKIDYHVKSRKHENRWYTSVIIEKIQITQKKSIQLMVDMETGEIY